MKKLSVLLLSPQPLESFYRWLSLKDGQCDNEMSKMPSYMDILKKMFMCINRLAMKIRVGIIIYASLIRHSMA
jgi:hypothetical protein